MSGYQTAAEAAAEVRAALKARGWGQRHVSVRAESYSLGSSLHVTVKSPEVDFEVARQIAEGKERVDRCERTGEILSGGNRFVHVKHSDECKAIIARRHLAALERAVVALEATPDGKSLGAQVPIEGTGVRLGWSQSYHAFELVTREGPRWLVHNTATPRGTAEGAYHVAAAHNGWRV